MNNSHKLRINITCNLPHPPRNVHGVRYESGVKGESTITESILHALETALCQQFGGYTSTPSQGGWMNEVGEVMHESGTLYNVSFIPGAKPGEPEAIALFTEAGERLGEDWIHIERQYFYAEHQRASNGRGDYNNATADNVSKIRQLDKPTRDHINNPGRPAEFVRR